MACVEGRDASAPSLPLLGHRRRTRQSGAVAPRPLRRGPHRRRDLGSRDRRHAEPHRIDGRRFHRLARSGFRPAGTLYAAVADEEAGGTYGSGWLARHRPDAIRADYTLTELGVPPADVDDEFQAAGDRGREGWLYAPAADARHPRHGSVPLRTDNALVKAARAVERLVSHATAAHVSETSGRFVEGMDFSADVAVPRGVEPPPRRDPILGVGGAQERLRGGGIAPPGEPVQRKRLGGVSPHLTAPAPRVWRRRSSGRPRGCSRLRRSTSG